MKVSIGIGLHNEIKLKLILNAKIRVYVRIFTQFLQISLVFDKIIIPASVVGLVLGLRKKAKEIIMILVNRVPNLK